jgi:hypothetical protein
MQDHYSYASEKFGVAVDGMATSPDRIQIRVAHAYIHSIVRLGPLQVPSELRDDLVRLGKRLSSVPPSGDEGSVMATVAKMTEDEAVELAKLIVHMHAVVEAHNRYR